MEQPEMSRIKQTTRAKKRLFFIVIVLHFHAAISKGIGIFFPSTFPPIFLLADALLWSFIQ
jgi:hypothetical protein